MLNAAGSKPNVTSTLVQRVKPPGMIREEEWGWKGGQGREEGGAQNCKTENKNKNMNVYRASFRREAGFIQNKSEARQGCSMDLRSE